MALTFDDAPIALPAGAWAGAKRRWLRRDGRPVLAFTPGARRPYVYPLYTPSGYAVTSEAPADHPHHQSVWIAADHVHAQVPASEGRSEAYTYNFYLDETFQGRAAGRLRETALDCACRGDDAFVAQSVDWRGPPEWAAPDGRTILRETRRHAVRVVPRATLVVVRSTLGAAQWTVCIGPTRHAYANLRVAESMQALHGGRITDETGASVAGTQTPRAAWIDYAGPVGGGRVAGVALVPLTEVPEPWWFVADWGVVTWNPLRSAPCTVAPGAPLDLAFAVVAHDGAADAAAMATWIAACRDLLEALR